MDDALSGVCASDEQPGGLSRSPLFTQLLADVLDRPVAVGATSEASALGAALCAGVGAGVFDDLRAAADALVQIDREHAPATGERDRYADLYPRWREVRERHQITPVP